MVQVTPTPDQRETVIVVGTSVRKPLPILQPFLQSLAWQDLPPRTKIVPIFVPDWPQSDEAEAYLRAWVAERGGECLRGVPTTAGDFSDAPQFDSHQWNITSMRRVGANKNKILHRARELHADAVWLCDADLILDTTTLASLLAAEKPVTSAVYWTHWTKRGFETRQIHAAPQVWLIHPYGLGGRGMDESEFRQKLISRELTRVWGFGACTLIRKPVLEAGIDFTPLPDVPQEGLMAGEDRQFCIRTERGHIEAYADPWPDIFHLYHADQHLPRVPEMVTRLSTPHPQQATLGDLVSLRLEALEPVPHANGGWAQVNRQHVRGRLGQIALMPELEEAVYDMTRGETRVVPVHFPQHHPLAPLRGRRRLIRTMLVDCKPLSWPPVLEDELYVGPKSGKAVDQTTLTDAQHIGIRQVAGVPT